MDKKLAEHNECFISHCTDDQKIMKRFTAILKKWYPDYLVFNSFDKGSLAGKKISDELRNHLARASFMIAFIGANDPKSAARKTTATMMNITMLITIVVLLASPLTSGL